MVIINITYYASTAKPSSSQQNSLLLTSLLILSDVPNIRNLLFSQIRYQIFWPFITDILKPFLVVGHYRKSSRDTLFELNELAVVDNPRFDVVAYVRSCHSLRNISIFGLAATLAFTVVS